MTPREQLALLKEYYDATQVAAGFGYPSSDLSNLKEDQEEICRLLKELHEEG